MKRKLWGLLMKPKSKTEAKSFEDYSLYKPFKHKGSFKKKMKRLLSKARRRDKSWIKD